MQMEKYAKQALAEGIKHREEASCTPFCKEPIPPFSVGDHPRGGHLQAAQPALQQKQRFPGILPQIDSMNCFNFQPPDELHFVVQETLREFFSALQQGKDAEPSWKKAIYKVIQQLDR